MDFILNDDQKMLRDMVQRLAAEKFAPLAAEVDEKEEFPVGNVKLLMENGLLGVNIPEEYGGTGAGTVALCLVEEEIAKVCCSTAVVLTTQALASDPMLLAGSEAVKKKYLYRLASGDCLGACGITEPGAGSDVAGMKTTATKVDG